MRALVGVLGLLIAASGCGGSGDGDSIPDAYLGIHHRETTGTAYNLEINADGTARWQLDGCDYLDGSELRASMEDGALTLRSADGSPTFSFAGDVVQSVRIVAEESGVRVTWGGPPQIEIWPTGAVCPSCGGGSLVPVAPPAACAEPFFDFLFE